MLNKDQNIIKIGNREETIETWEDRIKHYHTSNVDCSCRGFEVRGWCNHVGYKNWKAHSEKIATIQRNEDTVLKLIEEISITIDEAAKMFGMNIIEELLDKEILVSERDHTSNKLMISFSPAININTLWGLEDDR